MVLSRLADPDRDMLCMKTCHCDLQNQDAGLTIQPDELLQYGTGGGGGGVVVTSASAIAWILASVKNLRNVILLTSVIAALISAALAPRT